MVKKHVSSMSRRSFVKASSIIGLGVGVTAAGLPVIAFPNKVSAESAGDAVYTPQVQLLDASGIDKYANMLPLLEVAGGSIQTVLAGDSQIGVDMEEFKANMLPPSFNGGAYEGTWVWGYVTAGTDTSVVRDTYTGPVVVATRNKPTEFKFTNNLGHTDTTNVLAYKYTTDQSLHWANPNTDPMFVVNDDEPPEYIGNPAHYSGYIPAAVHLHGGEVPAAIDGGPESWFLSDGSKVGKAFYSKDGNAAKNYCVNRYPNTQEAAPLWFHDHTLGATRLNVYMGLAGAYALIDPKLKLPAGLNATGLRSGALGPNPADDTLVPLVVQDRNFDTEGQLFFNAGVEDPFNPSINPEHIYWVPEFFGNTIAVNGKVWPYMEVKAQRYRFYLINGSNARAYLLTFEGEEYELPIWQIGTDGGYLDKPVSLDRLVILPGERAEFILDFGGLSTGTELVLRNLGPDEPFKGLNPDGTLSDGEGGVVDPADPDTTGQVMQFRVVAGAATVDTSFDPAAPGATIRKNGRDAIIRLVNPETGTLAKKVKPDLTRSLTLNEIGREESITTGDGVEYEGGPLEALLNNSKWNGLRPDEANPNEHGLPVNGAIADGISNWLTEWPKEGDTEIWEIINTTADAHPIHTHLAQFQLMNREAFGVDSYMTAYEAAFPGGTFVPGYGPPLMYTPSASSGGKYGGNPDVAPYLSGDIEPPNPNEAGWKDTVFAPPGIVTRFVVRWAPTHLTVKNSKAASLRYDFIPNDVIPGNPGAIYDFVWHCHIVDHEDNEMMRPDAIMADPRTPLAARKFKLGEDY